VSCVISASTLCHWQMGRTWTPKSTQACSPLVILRAHVDLDEDP
jgi:hypothetical protein